MSSPRPRPRRPRRFMAPAAIALSLASPLRAQTFGAHPFSTGQITASASLALAEFETTQNKLDWTAMGATEGEVYAGATRRKFQWQTPFSTLEWRWQVSLKPFPEGWLVAPGQVLAEGKVTGHPFEIDFRDFPPLGQTAVRLPGASTSGPMVATPVIPVVPGTPQPGRGTPNPRSGSPTNHLATPVFPKPLIYYTRLVPTTGGKLAGPPSNVVTVRYHPTPDPVQQGVKRSFEMSGAEQAFDQSLQVYTLSLVNFRPAVFEQEGRWGCVELLTNPYLGKYVSGVPHPLYAYGTGEHCPAKDPSKQEGSTWDDVVEGVEAYLYLYDMVSGYWNQATSWFAAQTAGWLCKELGGDPETTCAVVQFVGDAALKAGLAAVGVPPSMPDLAALQDAAKGEISGAAADFTCTQINSSGGTCDEDEWKLLDAAFGVALDQLQVKAQKQMSEPGCGDSKTALLHGRLPLPCFSDYPGVQVKPALGSVYEPPVATVQVTRARPQPEPPPYCQVTVSLWLKNHFAGGNIPGLASAPFPEKDLIGEPFFPQQQVIPVLSPGQVTQIKIPLLRIQPYSIINNGWNPAGTMAEWKELYQGGAGGIQLASSTVTPLLAPGGFGKPQYRACGGGSSSSVQLPGAP